jgi:hypothetical protein
MIHAEFHRVAQNIIFDRNGANYYRDIGLLTNYIRVSFDASETAARQAAEVIHKDRDSANYYQDPKELASFLADKFGEMLQVK